MAILLTYPVAPPKRTRSGGGESPSVRKRTQLRRGPLRRGLTEVGQGTQQGLGEPRHQVGAGGHRIGVVVGLGPHRA